MKAREFIYLLGLKPRPRTYGSVVETYDLGADGRIARLDWTQNGTVYPAPRVAARP